MGKSRAQASNDAASSLADVIRYGRRRKASAGGRRKGRHVSIWLTPLEFDEVGAYAASMGMGRSTWIGALMRRQLHAKPTFNPSDERSLISVLITLRRIGVDISQTLRVIDAAVSDGKVLDAELADLTSMRTEIRSCMRAIHKAFDGNMTFWSMSYE